MSKLFEEFQKQQAEQQKPSSLYSEFLSQQTKPPIEQDIEPETLGGTLTNYAKYLAHLSPSLIPLLGGSMYDPRRQEGVTDQEAARQHREFVVNTAKQLGTNISIFTQDLASLLGNDTYAKGQVAQKYVEPFKRQGISNPLSPSGIVLGVAQMPIQFVGSLTGTVPGEDGTPRPATPQEEAHNVQSTIAMIAAGSVANKIAGTLAADPVALAGRKITIPGLMVRQAYPNIVSGLVSGATFGGISELGSDEQLASMVGSSLAFASLGALHSVIGTKSLAKEIGAAEGEIRLKQGRAESELAATKGLQITPDDSPIDVASKTKAFAESDNAVDAWINTNITTGKQVILQDIPKETVKKLTAKYTPATRLSEGPYRPSEEVADVVDRTKLQTGKKSIDVELVDTFDKATIASEKNPAVMQDLVKQTGLSEEEIVSHRMYVKDQIKDLAKDPKNLQQLGPTEIEVKKQEAIDRGKSLVSVPDGSSITDVNNNKWLKVGNTVTNGTQTLDVNSVQTHLALGLDKKFNPSKPVLRVGKQNFSPEFGRDVTPFHIYEGPNNTTLVSSYKLAGTVEAFFSQMGFMPGELVTVSGKPHTVVADVSSQGNPILTDLSTGRNRQASLDMIQRLPKGLDSEFYKASNGEQITRMGVYNRDTYFNDMYQKFRDDIFKLDEVPVEEYGKTIMKFANKIGMNNVQDIRDLSNAFHSRLVNEVLDGMDATTKAQYENSAKAIASFDRQLNDNLAYNLHQALQNNNMSLTSLGGGVYDIKDAVSGKSLGSVKSLDEAQRFVNKSGQSVGYDLDGGLTQKQAFIGGALLDSWTPSSNKLARFIDNHIFAGGPGTVLAKRRVAINAFDDRSGFKFGKDRYALDHGQNMISNLAHSPAMKELVDMTNLAIRSGKDIPDTRRMAIHDQVTSMEKNEIIKKFNLVDQDVKNAVGVSKVGTSEVMGFMNAVREESGYKSIGGKEFQAALRKVAKTGRYNENVMNVGTNLFREAKGDARTAATLLLARNLEHGSALPINLSSKELVYKNDLINAHKSIPGVDDAVWTYLPNSKLAEMTGYNPFKGLSPEFQRAYNRISSTPAGQIELDPSTVLYNLRRATIGSARIIDESVAYPQTGRPGNMISFNSIVENAEKSIKSMVPVPGEDPAILTQKYKNADAVIYYQRYLDAVKGIPDQTAQHAKAAELYMQEVFGPDYRSSPDMMKLGSSLVYSALLAGRPFFAFRDVINGVQNSFIWGGADFARKVAIGTLKREGVQQLMDQGKIPSTRIQELLNPNESVINGLSRLNRLADASEKLANISTMTNGQQLAHIQMSAGAYMAVYKQVGELSAKMVKNEISKQDAYTKMGIQRLHPQEQLTFDSMISAGKTVQAAEYLGTVLTDRWNPRYGGHNAPQAWRSWFGRLAGGFGQWAVGQIATNVDVLARGTRRQMTESWIRMAVSNRAIRLAGLYTGINLSKSVISPYSVPGISPLMDGMLGITQDADNTGNLDPAISNPAATNLFKILPMVGSENGEIVFKPTENWAHLYIPGSYFIQSEIDAVRMLNGDFGPVAVGQALLGYNTIKSAVSPLQNQLGLQPEFKDRAVPNVDNTDRVIQQMAAPFPVRIKR